MIYLNKILLHRPLPEESYLHTLPAVRWLSQTGALTFPAPVTFFVGENGTGKSSLLEAIAVACGFNAEGGSKNFSFSTFRSHSPLHESLTPSRLRRERDGFFLRAESFYNVATNIEEMDREIADVPYISASPLVYSYGGVSLHGQSHGESFLSLVRTVSAGRGFTCWTNRNRPFPPPDSWPYWRRYTGWYRRIPNSSSPPTPPFSWPILGPISGSFPKPAWKPSPMRKPSIIS